MTVEAEFLEVSAGQLLQLMERIEVCVGKLTPAQVWMRGGNNQNAVGNLLLHLNGNVRQWILHGVGGQPDLRERDAEFSAQGGFSSRELLARLRGTIEEAAALLRSLPPERLLDHTRNQGYECTVLAAVYHVVEHFSGHAFQIIYATKLWTGEDLGFYAHLSAARPHENQFP